MNSLTTANHAINVPFHGAALYVVNHNGEPYTPMKPIVEGMGMDWMGQYTKLKQRFAKGIEEISIPTTGGAQKMICLALRKLNGWLQTISPNKVRPEIRDNVIRYQEECDDVLYEYWTKGVAVNPRKAKSASGKITPEQQEAIKELVKSRGDALPPQNRGRGMVTMWSALKSHFGITYKEIRADQFTEALSLVARLPLEGELLERQPPAQPVMPTLPPGYIMIHQDDHIEMLGRRGIIAIHYSELDSMPHAQMSKLIESARKTEAKWTLEARKRNAAACTF